MIDKSHIRVLLLESYTRQVLPMAKAFKRLGCEVDTLNDSKFDLGYITRYADNRFVVHGVSNDEKILEDILKKLISQRVYDVIVPLSDFSANYLSHSYDLYRNDVSLAVNELDLFCRAYDKLYTMKICAENGIPSPMTALKPTSIEDIDAIGYPIITKPRSECGSIGLHILADKPALVAFLEQNPDAYSINLFQKYIQQTGKQYNAQAFVNADGAIRMLIVTEKVRWFPLDGGASTMCMEVENPTVSETCSKLLKAMEWKGYCDIDLIEDPNDGIAKVIEVNARISANVKICFASGIDIAKQILEFYKGKDVQSYTNYARGRRLRCFHTDLLWFIKSPDRLTRKPSWFSCKKSSDQIFDLRDPLPFVTFSFRAIRQYKGAMEKRKR